MAIRTPRPHLPRMNVRLLIPALLAAGVTLGAPSGAAGQQAAPTCDTPNHRAFDFWVGEWNVYDPSGRLVGENVITLEMNDCVVHESYTAGSYHGESFSLYDRSRDVWHQTWVDQAGALLLLEGRLSGTAMVLEGTTVQPDGGVALNRVTWTPREDGSVHQRWQTTTDGGATWTTAFDGVYRRR